MVANNKINKKIANEVVTTRIANKNTESLSVLMAAAMALPSIAAAQWDPNVRNDHVVLSYNHSVYEEPSGQSLIDGLEFIQGNLVIQPINRMHIVADQLSATIPIADRYQVKFNAVQDIMTGTSIVLVAPAVNNPNQVLPVTTTSSPDKRRAVDVTGAYFGDDHYIDLKIGESSEDDYKSKFISSNYRHYFNDKTTTIMIGGSFSDDVAWATPNPIVEAICPPCIYRPGYQDRRSHELSLGISQILNRNSVIQFILGNNYSYGNLNDPYRLTGVFNGGIITQFAGQLFDQRPDYNSQWSALVRYSHYFEKTNSALHLDYRYIDDSWDANSHTLEAKWRVDVGGGWFISPGLRYYTQEAANFYQPYLSSLPAQAIPVNPVTYQLPSNQYITSDYRLSGFGVISPKIEVVKIFDSGIMLRASYEKMIRKHEYALFGSTGFSGEDFNSQLFSLGVSYAF